MPPFPPEVIAAVTAHMNTDHDADNLLIVRAFAQPDATSAVMIDLDETGGVWEAALERGTLTVRVPWIEPVADRPSIRRAVVQLYRAACERLGTAPREH